MLAVSVPALQARTENISTHEREIPFDSTIAETVHESDENVVNLTVKATQLPSSNKAARNSTLIATSAEDSTVLRRDGLENTTAAFKKQDYQNLLPEFNCRQLKNRESVSPPGLFRAREEKKALISTFNYRVHLSFTSSRFYELCPSSENDCTITFPESLNSKIHLKNRKLALFVDNLSSVISINS